MDWTIGLIFLIWCIAGLLAAIVFGRAVPKDNNHG